ncbi:transcriptional regulator NrdR [Citroniella saccharovorans]|uniref:Transcriptional repressor NrdR n=1 Tax=Citroniella saccharovorans TaxID=2053367 RepID=A0AAW9MZ26_9FIRM|nr:transcriptional regulator NrdR [Citroniella saccharovorans]MEB3429840.1 transcriptional regulator NrdR [Citroniella saccharovorans]
MKCPYCNFHDTKVVDSRPTEDNMSIRRRRMCLYCNKRFTTYERYEDTTLMVIKKDQTREAFVREKVLKGMIRSCEKRPVSIEDLEAAVDEIEISLNHLNQKEVTSTLIGDMVMDKLKELDEVSYIRFASVYREFKDVTGFLSEVKNLNKEDN